MGAVDEFEAFADAAEDHRMLADDIAGAHGEQRDLFLAALADDALTAVDCNFFKIAVERVCDRTPKCQRRAARRVFLEAMVRFDDLDVVIVAEHLRRLTQERNKNVDSQAGVRREQRRRAPGKPFDFGLLFGIEPSRGNDDRRKFFRRAP